MNLRRQLPGRALAWVTARPSGVLKPYTPEHSLRERCVVAVAISALTIALACYGFFYAITTPFLLTQMLAPFLLLVGVGIWALPDGRRAPRRTLEDLLFALFVLLMLWPTYLAIDLPGLPWINSVRLVGFPLAFVCLVAVSTSAEFRREAAYSLTSIPRLWQLMAAYVALQALSIVTGEHPLQAVNGFLADQLRWTLVFFVSAFVFLRPGSIHKWAVVFWVSAIIVCLIGLWEKHLDRLPWAGHLPSFFAYDEYVQRALAGQRRLGVGALRIQSVQSTSLGCAEFLALVTPFLLHFICGPFTPRMRLAAAATLPLVLYVIIITGARLGMVGFFLACLLYFAAWAYIRWRRDRSNLSGAIILYGYPAIFSAVLVATFTIGRLKRMVWGGGETAASNQARIDQVNGGIPLVLQRPWGYGYNQGAGMLGYTNGAETLTIDNYFLAVALDLGILGLLVYGALILLPLLVAVRHGVLKPSDRHSEHSFLLPIASALSIFFVIKTIFSIPHNHSLHFAMAGMVAALIYRINKGVPGDAPDTPAGPPIR